eukprot:5351081-Amphidinium_carterae.1
MHNTLRGRAGCFHVQCVVKPLHLLQDVISGLNQKDHVSALGLAIQLSDGLRELIYIDLAKASGAKATAL